MTGASDGSLVWVPLLQHVFASGNAEVQSIAPTPSLQFQVRGMQKRDCARRGSEAACRGRWNCALVAARTAVEMLGTAG